MVKIIEVVALLFILALVATIPFLVSQASATSSPSSPSAGTSVPIVNGVQEIRLHASPDGYSLSSFTVKQGIPVRILFSADQYAGCGRQLLMPEFGVNQIVDANQEVPIEFTPNQQGTFAYRCSMNMFKGTMNVVA